MVKRQNTTHAFLQLIVVREILVRVKVDLIDICTKPDREYVWILHFKGHFLKSSMLYTLTSKNASEITFYIKLFVLHLGIPGILQFDNGRKFIDALLLFTQMYNITLINVYPRTLQTKRLVEQANAIVKNKIAKWKAVNGTRDRADSLTKFCDTINNQTHQSLPSSVIRIKLMFSRKPEFSTSRTIFTKEKRDKPCNKSLLKILIVFVKKQNRKKVKYGNLSLIAE